MENGRQGVGRVESLPRIQNPWDSYCNFLVNINEEEEYWIDVSY